jgi:hypothetical protein
VLELVNWAQTFGVWIYMICLWGFFMSKGFKMNYTQKLFDGVTMVFHFVFTIIALIKVFFL